MPMKKSSTRKVANLPSQWGKDKSTQKGDKQMGADVLDPAAEAPAGRPRPARCAWTNIRAASGTRRHSAPTGEEI